MHAVDELQAYAMYSALQEVVAIRTGGYQLPGGISGPWGMLLSGEQAFWFDVVHAFRKRDPITMVAAIPAPFHDYKAELLRYGRHAPMCPTSGPCSCGFAEVEKELKAA